MNTPVDPLRSQSRNLALALAGPPSRVVQATPTLGTPAADESAPRALLSTPTALLTNRDSSNGESGLGESGLNESTQRRNPKVKAKKSASRSDVGSVAKSSTRTHDVDGGELAVNALTITLDSEAHAALEAARVGGLTVREAMLLAVRATQRQMEMSNPDLYIADDDLPIARLRPRRRLDTPGTKVPVRFYGPEREALQRIADRLGRSVSGLISDSLIASNQRSATDRSATD